MDGERYERLAAIFAAAVDLDDDVEREACLDDACGSDAALRAEVAALVARARAGADPTHPFADERLDAVRERLERLASGSRRGATTTAYGPSLSGADAAVPALIGRYRIVRRIAAGGMGVVYEATQESPRRRVALKIVPPHRATPDRLRRFRQEAEVLGRLQHPGIAQVHEAGTFDLGEGAQPFFAMEYVDGVDVRTHAERAGLGVRERLALVAEIADAVHHAHEKGVIHRDLKPDNVFVDGQGRAKVLDFGVARVAEASTAISTVLTHEGQIIGTLSYMAPEQLSADPERVTPRADVYALGVMAFELLTGRLPHDLAGLPTTAAIRALTEADAPRLGRLDSHLRGDVETIVGAALEKDPARRYGSAAALAADIRRHLDHLPITARPPSALYRARKFARRNRALVAGTVATLVTLAIGLAVSLLFAHEASHQRDAARTSETNARRNEAEAVAGLLEATQSLVDAGRPWDARLRHDGVPEDARGWCWSLVDRELPFELDGPRGLNRWWRFIDRDHLMLLDTRADRVEIRSLLDRADVRTLFAGLGIRQFELAPGVRRLTAVTADEDLLLDLRTVTILDRWPKTSDLPALISADGRVQVRFNDDGRTELRVDDAIRAVIEDVRSGWLSPDGRLLAVRGTTWVEVRDVETGAVVFRRAPAGERMRADSFDGGFFLFGSDRHVERYEIHDGVAVGGGVELAPSGAGVVRWSLDGRLISIAGGGQRHPVVRDARTGAPFLCSRYQDEQGAFDYEQPGEGVGIAPDGTRACLQSGYRRPWVVELDPREREPGFDPRCVTLRGHTSWIYHVAVSHDGSLVASAAPEDRMIRVWDATTGEQVGRLERVTRGRSSWDALLAFTPEDDHLVVTTPYGASPMAIVDWNLVTGAVDTQAVDPGPDAGSHIALLDPFIERARPLDRDRLSEWAQVDGATALATRIDVGAPGSGRKPDESLRKGGRRWHLAPGEGVFGIDARGISIHPTQRRVAIVFREELRPDAPTSTQADAGDLVVVDADTGAEIARCALEHEPRSCAYSPDGTLLAVGMHDGTVVLYDTEFLMKRLTLSAHDPRTNSYAYVYALAWTPDGTRLITASGDRTLKIWDGRTVAASRRAEDAWRALRERMAARGDLAEAYPSLKGAERAAGRIALMRKGTGAAADAATPLAP